MDETPQAPPAASSGERRRKLGRLKVFLGIGPGVGKTGAMLRAAREQRLAGRHVVILDGVGDELENDEAADDHAMPRLANVDAVLARQPDIAIIDALAARNPPEARHDRRFRDALSLLEAGIDVYGTLNIYEIASRAEILWETARLPSVNAVPDSVFDNADIAFIDMPPAELAARLKAGQFHLPEKLPERFLDETNLLELREMAARLLAERAARDAQRGREAGGPARSSHRLLTAVEFGWEAESLIFLTRRLAGSLNAPWILLCVEAATKDPQAPDAEFTRLLELARELGAEVITTSDDHFVDAVLRVAVSRNITQIITGKTAQARWWRRPFEREPAFAELARRSHGIDVHVAAMVRPRAKPLGAQFEIVKQAPWQWAAAVIAVAAVLGGGFLIRPLVPSSASSLLSLLAIVGIATFLHRRPALVATAFIAVGWDYFFLPPYFHLSIARPEDKLLMAMYFTVALVLCQFTSRLRAAEAAERQREARATALYLLTRELADAHTTYAIVEKVVAEMKRSFDADAAVLLADDAQQLQPQSPNTLATGEKEFATAAWAFERRRWAGKFTGNLPMLDTMFLPLESSRRMVGVMGVRLARPAPPTIHERNLLEAFARQAAVALDHQQLREFSEKAEVIAASERLGKTLLDSMSHEIRTPLTVIQAAANDLDEIGEVSAAGRAALGEIHQATSRLNRLVGQVLDITRLESGHVQPLIAECEVADIVHSAVNEMERQLANHPLKVAVAPELPLLRTDFVFVQQALMNLLGNAAIHTEPGTPIELRAWRQEQAILFVVADCGPGIDPQFLPRVFDKFYRGPTAPTGGVGLGLSLVKGFVKALGGNVTAANRAGNGVEFTITLPLRDPGSLSSVAI